eukprot:scaffold17495_cov21-Phaeocystis_antarctica.AAC.1
MSPAERAPLGPPGRPPPLALPAAVCSHSVAIVGAAVVGVAVVGVAVVGVAVVGVALASRPAAVCSQRWASELPEILPPEIPPLPAGRQLLCEAWLGLGIG